MDMMIGPIAGNATPAVAQAISRAGEGTVIKFEKGVYDFYSEGAHVGYFTPSNNANGIKKVIFPLLAKRGVTIDGGGARFVFHSRVFPFVVQDSQYITLKNFEIDFSFPRYAVGTVLSSDEEGFTLRVSQADFPNFIQNGCWIFQAGDQVRSTAETKFFLNDPAGGAPVSYLVAGDTRDPLMNLPARLMRTDALALEEGAVRLTYRPGSDKVNYQVGCEIIISHDENRENDLFFLDSSRQVTLSDITIYRGAGMGVIGQMCRDVFIDSVSMRVLPGRNEPISITADAFHFVQCDGRLAIRNSHVSDTLDDAVNIHGVYTRVEKLEGGGVVAQIGHHEQYGLNPYRPGDSVRIVAGDGSHDRGRLTVTESRPDADGKKIRISFAEEPSCVVEAGDYIENPDRSAEVLLEGNTFERCPRVLLGSSEKTVVRGNTLRLDGALAVIDGMAYWFEAGRAEDVLIEKNRFEGCGLKHGGYQVDIILKQEAPSRRVHKNVRLMDNDFTGNSKSLRAQATDGLTIQGNRGFGVMRMDHCLNVKVENDQTK